MKIQPFNHLRRISLGLLCTLAAENFAKPRLQAVNISDIMLYILKDSFGAYLSQ